MLQTQSKNGNLATLIALKPRQIMLSISNMKKTQKLSFQNASPDQKTLLLQSMAQFLQRNGFSKTLKKFRSESKLNENDDWNGCLPDLEEMYFKCLETSSHANTNFDSNKEQGLQIDGITKKAIDNCVTSDETVSKKKKSRSDESDSNTVVEQPGLDVLVLESNVKSKEKTKNKKSFDAVGQGREQVSAEVLKAPADDIACEPQLDESNKKSKDKKKKRGKLVSETPVDNVEHHHLEALSGMAEDNSKDVISLEGKSATDSDINTKSKDKKKNKNKVAYDSQVVNSTLDNANEIPSEKNVKSKSKKRKKDDLLSESLLGGDTEDATIEENKGFKKLKRLASEENESQPIDKVAVEEFKIRKTEGLEEAKESEQLMKVNALLESDGHAGNRSRDENDKVSLKNTQKTSIKQLDMVTNGNLESVLKTSKKQRNGSAEPKTINAFQRVKVDEVVFVDEKLQDNSYWAKDGAEIGYGAKAQEVLGQVRGRGFRHEKTKKKRGSYRGGQIDLQSHSVKFNYSDEE